MKGRSRGTRKKKERRNERIEEIIKKGRTVGRREADSPLCNLKQNFYATFHKINTRIL